jgi:hypothetical protein
LGWTGSAWTNKNTPTGVWWRFDSVAWYIELMDWILDEIRLRGGVLSGDRISTEYNNQDSPSTFYSITEAVTQNSNFFMVM